MKHKLLLKAFWQSKEVFDSAAECMILILLLNAIQFISCVMAFILKIE